MSNHHHLIITLTATTLIGLSACSSDTLQEQSIQEPSIQESFVRKHINSAQTKESVPMAQSASDVSASTAVLESSMIANSHLPIAPTLKSEPYRLTENRERYKDFDDQSVVVTANEPTSTFSIDVDTGAYANVRRFLNAGTLPPENAVRVEEMLNYFDYDYPLPDTLSTPFSVTTELAPTPWNSKTHLLHVGLNGYDIDETERSAANLVFLIDVSGSMSSAGKLGLVKPAVQMLVNQLNKNDTVSIVVYAGDSGVALEPTTGDKKSTINRAIQSLRPGGSTNGEAGIELAYALAEEHRTTDSANRVILVTDGDFNVGLASIDQLKKLIEKKRESGIALTTLGFGQGNYNDHLMEQLADVGNGAYAYIDTLNEARKVLIDELSGTLLTIAKDVKIQVEFNPAVVSEYRLIGYENRALANEDFANDNIDAGEIGAGHTVTALYELALVGSGGERNAPLRYQTLETGKRYLEEIGELRIRYKQPGGSVSQLISKPIRTRDISANLDKATANFNFSAAVAAFGQYLRGGKYLNGFSLDETLTLVATNPAFDAFGYRQEFINLVRLAKSLGDISENTVQTFLPKDDRG